MLAAALCALAIAPSAPALPLVVVPPREELVCGGYAAPAVGGGKLCFPRAAQVLFVTEHGPAGETPRRTQQQTAINVPTPIDVDGNAGADIVATFRVASTSSFVLEVAKAAGAPATLPVSVVAMLKDPGGSTDRYVLGYDAREKGAPATFSETIAPRIAAHGTALDIDVATSGAGDALALVGQVHTAGAAEAIVNPTHARVGFAPVPANIGADLFFPAAGAQDRTTAALTTGAPATVTLSGGSTSGAETTTFGGTLDRLAGTFTAVITNTPVPGDTRLEAGDANTVAEVTATGAQITTARLEIVEKINDAQDTKTVATITDVPSTTTVTLKPATRSSPLNIVATAAPAAGVVDVERVEGAGDAVRLGDGRFARVVVQPNAAKPAEAALKSAAARLTGLEKIDVKIAEGHTDVLAKSAAGPLHVLVDGHGPRIEATATSLPPCVRFAYTKSRETHTCSDGVATNNTRSPDPDASNPKTKVILLEGSQASPGTVDVTVDPVEGGKKLIAKVQGLPRRGEVVMTGPERLDVDTAGGEIGRAEVTLTSGPTDDVLPANQDGIRMRNKLSQDADHEFHREREVLFARARQVRTVRFGLLDGDLAASLDSAREDEFQVDIEQDEIPDPRSTPIPFTDVVLWHPAVVKYFHVNATKLRPKTNLTFDDRTGAVKIHYDAQGEIPLLTLGTNFTGSLYTNVTATNVARNLDVCISPGNHALGGDQYVCNVNPRFDPAPLVPNGPTLRATAAPPDQSGNPMHVWLMDCKKLDSQGQCGADRDEAEYLRLDAVSFRKLVLQLHTQASGDTDAAIDTDDEPVHGSLQLRTHASKKPDKAFATFYGVRAQNRKLRIATALAGQGAPVQTAGSARGTITCTQDANGKFDVYVVDNGFIGSLLLPVCFAPVAADPGDFIVGP